MGKKLISNKIWMQIHLYVSLFFIPMALIYAITGTLYIFDIRQNAGAKIFEVPLQKSPIKGSEREFMLEILEKHKLDIPKNTEIKVFKSAPMMGDLKYSVMLTKDKNGNLILRAIDRHWYGVLLMLHKSAGKYYFDILAVGFSIALIILYLSGLFLTAFCKRNYLGASVATILGFVITTIAVCYSL